MKAILTRYLGPTDYRGSRIVATAEGGRNYDTGRDTPHRLTIPYDYAANDGGHRAAAYALRDRLGWTGEMVGGTLPNGDQAWVFGHDGETVAEALARTSVMPPHKPSRDYFAGWTARAVAIDEGPA